MNLGKKIELSNLILTINYNSYKGLIDLYNIYNNCVYLRKNTSFKNNPYFLLPLKEKMLMANDFFPAFLKAYRTEKKHVIDYMIDYCTDFNKFEFLMEKYYE
jgi:hypothetical protein